MPTDIGNRIVWKVIKTTYVSEYYSTNDHIILNDIHKEKFSKFIAF